MRTQKIKANIVLYILLCASFFVLAVNGSDTNENDSKDINTQDTSGLNGKSLNLLSIIVTLHEKEYLSAILIKLLISYLILMMKFISLFDDNVLVEHKLLITHLIYHFETHTTYVNKEIMIDRSKLMKIFTSCLDYLHSDGIIELNSKSNSNAYSFIIDIVQNHAEILAPVKEAILLLEYLSSELSDRTIFSMSLMIPNHVRSIISLLEKSVDEYKKMSRKHFQKMFNSRKHIMGETNILMKVSSQRLESINESKQNHSKHSKLIKDYELYLEDPNSDMSQDELLMAKQLFKLYYDNFDCNEMEILEKEMTILTSIEMLGLISFNVFYFDSNKLKNTIREIEETRMIINEDIVKRGTEASVSDDQVLDVRTLVMEKLEYNKVLEFNNLSSKFGTMLSRETLLSNIKNLYLHLLKLLVLLKKELQSNDCGEYVQRLLTITISLFEKLGKESAVSIKSYEHMKNISITPFEAIRVERENTISRCKQIIDKQIKQAKERMRLEEEKKRELEIEKKKEEEKISSELKKIKEERKERNKNPKKRFPEIKDDLPSTKESTPVSSTIESQMIKTPVRNKAERKKKLQEKISNIEKECLLKEQIRAVIRSEKSTRQSEKKRRKEQRTKQRILSREKESERGYGGGAEGAALYSESFEESDSSDEDATRPLNFPEAARGSEPGKTDLETMALPILKIAEGLIDSDHSEQKQSSDKESKDTTQGACSESSKTIVKRTKRRADEKHTDSPLVESTLLLLEGASFEPARVEKDDRRVRARVVSSSVSFESLGGQFEAYQGSSGSPGQTLHSDDSIYSLQQYKGAIKKETTIEQKSKSRSRASSVSCKIAKPATLFETKSRLHHRSRARSHSPLKARARSQSPHKARARSHSPHKARARSHSPLKARTRSQSPLKARARSQSPLKTRARSHSPHKARARSHSPHKARARSHSPHKARARSHSPRKTRAGARKCIQDPVKQHTRLDLDTEYTQSNEFVLKLIELDEKMSQSQQTPNRGESRFISMFSEQIDSPRQTVDILNFFGIQHSNLPSISETSTLDDLESAIEIYSDEITRIHTEVLPLLTGIDSVIVRSFQTDLIRKFIKMLIMLNNVRQSSS